jgi:hypothetical protein
MSVFQLQEFLPVKVVALMLPAKKKGSDVVHTTDITIEAEGANALLTLFDPKLIDQWYRAVESDDDEDQGTLNGVERVSDKPILRTSSIAMPVRLSLEFAGYTMTIDRGLGRPGSNIVVDEVTVKSIRMWMKEGGSVKVSMHLQSKNVGSDQVGQLRDFLKLETKLQLIAPKLQQDIGLENDQRRAAAAAKRAGAPAPAPTPAAKGAKGAGKGANVTPIAKGKKPTKEDTARAATDEFTKLHEAQQAAAANKGGDGAAPAA